MGAVKKFAEEVSYVMGKDGEITDEVLVVSQRVAELASNLGLTREQLKNENFIRLVRKAEAEILGPLALVNALEKLKNSELHSEASLLVDKALSLYEQLEREGITNSPSDQYIMSQMKKFSFLTASTRDTKPDFTGEFVVHGKKSM